MLLRFKNSIASAAALSSSVTIDCNRAPAATSNAVAYSLSTLPNSATVPIIPDNFPSSRHCKIALTPLAYPPNSSLALCAASFEANFIDKLRNLPSRSDKSFWYFSIDFRTSLCFFLTFSKFWFADLFPISISFSWKSASFASVTIDSNHFSDRITCSSAFVN